MLIIFHFITGRANCDLLINNVCEVFNRQLLDARDSPIISCLEYVREYLMKRIVIVQNVIEKSEGILTPAVSSIFSAIKEKYAECTVDWNGADLYQVKCKRTGEQVVVNITERVCSCRKWAVSGIPCKHAVACIHDMIDHGNDVGLPEDWVHRSYKLETWREVYSFKVNPVNGRQQWEKFDCPTTLLPPKTVPKIGRPQKNRKKSAGELEMVKDGKLSRKGKLVTCLKCRGTGHNSRSCKGNSSSNQAETSAAGAKRGRTSQPHEDAGMKKARKPNASQGTHSAKHAKRAQGSSSQPVRVQGSADGATMKRIRIPNPKYTQ